MTHVSRRTLLLGTSGLTVAALAGCANPPSEATLKTYIDAVANGAATIATDLPGAGVKIPQATLDQVNAAVADIKSNDAAIAAAIAGSAGAKKPLAIASAVSQDVTTLSTLLTPFFPQASGIGTLLVAATSVVSTILTLAGATGAAASAPAPRMAPPLALAVLQAAR